MGLPAPARDTGPRFRGVALFSLKSSSELASYLSLSTSASDTCVPGIKLGVSYGTPFVTFSQFCRAQVVLLHDSGSC